MSDTRISDAIEVVDARFRSGNAIPIDRAWVPRQEWEALKSAIEAALPHVQQAEGEEVSVAEDVYSSIADMIEPYVKREGSNPEGPLPASVHDSVQIIFDHWLETRAQDGAVQAKGADALLRLWGERADRLEEDAREADSIGHMPNTVRILEKRAEQLRRVIREFGAAFAANGKQQAEDLKCKDCGTPLLYECTGCSATNYPQQGDALEALRREYRPTMGDGILRAWAADVVAALAANGKQQVGAFPWENLPAYLIDKCEGDTISEEGIQRAVADMAKDARYCPTQQAGEVQTPND